MSEPTLEAGPEAGPSGHAGAQAAQTVLSVAVVVAALGYFVDIYDLVLFGVVRMPSLKALGVTGQGLLVEGTRLFDLQMYGMLLGGIVWGIVGDRIGRLRILFGSITLYSIATIANGFVTALPAYGWLRFAAGFGLAGELGAGITLVSEILPAKARGYGTMIVASVGVSGAVAANLVATQFDWRVAYYTGGGLGLVLLALRIGVHESSLWKRTLGSRSEAGSVGRGNFLALFTSRDRFGRYLRSVLIGTPTWYVVGVLMLFAPELAHAMGIQGTVTGGNAIMYCYLGLVAGDVASGTLSQVWRSRRKVVLLFLALIVAGVAAYFTVPRGGTPGQLYAVCFALGIAAGYWAIFVTVAAEQFGTNLRATVATTVPNFVRGMVPPITAAFKWAGGHFGLSWGALLVGAVCLGIAFAAAFPLEETFGKDLDWLEK
jgi:MFS family permease